MAVRILLADDSPLVVDCLRSLLSSDGFEVVGEAADGEGAVNGALALRPDVAILDVSMPKMNGVEAARVIRDHCPEVHTIMLTAYDGDHLVMAALRAGARGFVVKTDAADDLARAVHAVARGELFISPSASRSLVEYCLPDLPATAAHSLEGMAAANASRGNPSGSSVFSSPPDRGFTD